jgi:hypothetical protein
MTTNVNVLIDFYNHCVDSYDLAAGRAWYESAKAECQSIADEFGLSLRRVIWIVAVLSPRLNWAWNVSAARAIITGATSTPKGCFGANVSKARAIRDASEAEFDAILRGPKVRAFAANILGDPNTVTIDTWAWRIWACDLFTTPNSIRNHDEIAADYRAAAAEIGLAPNQFQAATWVAARRLVNDIPSGVTQ